MIDYLEQESGQADALEEQRRRLAVALTSAAAAGESGWPTCQAWGRRPGRSRTADRGRRRKANCSRRKRPRRRRERCLCWRRPCGWSGLWTAPEGSGRSCLPPEPGERAGRPGKLESSAGDSLRRGAGETRRLFWTGRSRRRAERGPFPAIRIRRRSGSRPEIWTGSFSGTAAGMTGAFPCIDKEERG